MSVWEQLATGQFDLWQVVPRQVFTSYFRLFISTVFVVVSRSGCLGITGVRKLDESLHHFLCYILLIIGNRKTPNSCVHCM